MQVNKWDGRFMDLAQLVSTWSKDPSTQTGAVIVNQQHGLVSVGFNGFPRGIKDDKRLQDRVLKYDMVVHAEVNAVLAAERSLVGYDIYVHPYLSCSRCASVIIQTRIERIVAPKLSDNKQERWGANLELAKKMYNEVGIEVVLV